MPRILLLAAVATLASTLDAQSLRTIPIRRAGTVTDNVGLANLIAADLNSDNNAEVISCGAGAPFAVTASGLASNANSFAVYWQGPAVNCVGVGAGDVDQDKTADVVVVTSGSPGKVMIFNPRSLGQALRSWSLPGNNSATDVAVANVDDDPALEIIALTTQAAYVYDGATLALQWTATGYGGNKVLVADVDGNGPDIVINGSTGYVLDGQQNTLKFGYLNGFGSAMTAADVDGDFMAEIIYTNGSSTVTKLNGDNGTTSSWNTSTSCCEGIGSIGAGDANNDGSVEIITGSSYSGTITGRRAGDGQAVWSIASSDYGTSDIVVANIKSSLKPEVIWGAGTGSSSLDVLHIGDASTQTIKWSLSELDAPFSSVVGDLDGDGALEFVVASSGGSYSTGAVQIFDLATGASKGFLTMPSGTGQSIRRLAIGQVDSDPAKEIIALNSSYYYSSSGALVVWDGVTKAVEFSSAPPSCCSSPTINLYPLIVANIDNDATDEIIVGQSDQKILVFNGATNIIQAAQPISGSLTDIALVDLNSAGPSELIALTSSTLYVFDSSTWAIRGQVAISSYGGRRVAGTSAGGGTVAMVDEVGQLRVFSGMNLATQRWMCTGTNYNSYSNAITSLAFASVDGSDKLIAGDGTGNLRLYPIDGSTCPAYTPIPVTSYISNVTAGEWTGDGRTDLLIDTNAGTEVHLIGLTSVARGDVNNDTLVNAQDIEAITDYVFGAPGMSPAADSNADNRIGVEDVFALIGYYYAGGAAPLP